MNHRNSLFAGTISLFAMAASLGACTATLGPDEEDAGTGGADAAGTGGASSGGAAPSTGGATSSGGATSNEITPTFANFQNVITYASCAGSDCHGGGHNPLDLSREGLYERLIDPNQISEICGNLPVITPGNPAQSALFVIMTDGCWTTEMKGGVEVDVLLRMPAGCTVTDSGSDCVPQEYLDAIEQWILDGALQN
jgi:hypothetical protein